MFRFHVSGMTCGGCAKSVAKAVSSVDPKARVEADPSTGEVRIDSSAEERMLLAAIEKAGYPTVPRPEAALG